MKNLLNFAKANYPKNVKVYVPAPGGNWEEEIFQERGFIVVKQMTDNPDIIVFTGGTDINPHLYGEDILATTQEPDYARDRREINLYRAGTKMFKVGICRGGQLLNVLNGGKLWQHVDQHSRSHPVFDMKTMKYRMVSSTHHQQFRPARDAEIVALAELSTLKYAQQDQWIKPNGARGGGKDAVDYEVLWYKNTRSLCFQPHPEYPSPVDTEDYFFELIERYF